MLLAEQIVIDCPPRSLEDLLRHRPVDWLIPLLRLAGDEGEASGLALLGTGSEPPAGVMPAGTRQHRVEVGEPVSDEGSFRADLRWWAADYRALFDAFDGVVEVRPLQGHSVLSIEGPCTGPATAARRRAAECAVRSLLGHLRAAVEASPLSAR